MTGDWDRWMGRIYDPLLWTDLALLVLVLALAFAAPRLGGQRFAQGERVWRRLAARPLVAIGFVGLLAVAGRAALLPWLGVAVPTNHDEHSFFLQAQTFLSGRLANPTPAFWEHFEEIHINLIPVYASMYFPGRSFPLLVGMLLFDEAWLGIWLSFIVMCMAIVWMLRGWVSPSLALLGGVLVVLRLGLFSYWVNSYWSGAFTALGAVLILGAFPRLLRRPGWTHGVLMGLGAVILLTNRPFEGALLCLPIAVALLMSMFRRHGPPVGRTLVRVGLPAVAILAAGGWLMLEHNRATTGDALTAPYTVNRQLYAVTPAFLVAPPVNGLERGPDYFRRFYQWEDTDYRNRDNIPKMIWRATTKLYYVMNIYIGWILLPAFLAGLWASRRDWLLLGTSAFVLGGFVLQTWSFPHYVAPIFPVLLILLMRGFAALRDWRPFGRPGGRALTRFMPVAVVLSLLIPFLSLTTGWPPIAYNHHNKTCCVFLNTSLRLDIIAQLRADPGRDIVLVVDGERRNHRLPLIYNEPDIASADIIWANRLSPASDAALLRHYGGRKVWELDWLSDGSPHLRRIS